MDWPQRGVYFFFEEGELRDDGVSHRVVRVGTHALRNSNSTLWSRLSQHKGSTGGPMPGGGNHRGSIFRLHVGTSLLAQNDWSDAVKSSWGVGSTARGRIRADEYALECAVTRCIGAMPFLWIAIGDEPSAKSDRGLIESGAISLLSNWHRQGIDLPSNSWLGQEASREPIRESGLWNVNHVKSQSDSTFLKTLSKYVAAVS